MQASGDQDKDLHTVLGCNWHGPNRLDGRNDVSCGLRAPRARSESKRALDMRLVGRILGGSSIQPVDDGAVVYVMVSLDESVHATEDMAVEDEDAIGI